MDGDPEELLYFEAEHLNKLSVILNGVNGMKNLFKYRRILHFTAFCSE